jgi:hypothetical protein
MSATIVTEGSVDKALLERLLACHPRLRGNGIQVRDAGGRYGAQSKARTILTLRRESVAVVSDADTLDAEAIAEQRNLLEMQLGQAAPASEWRVILLAPEVEVLLFRDEQLRRSLLPREPSPEQLEHACSSPKQVLAELFAQAGEQPFPDALLRRLERADMSSLWETPELRPLAEFLLEKSAAQQPGTAP